MNIRAPKPISEEYLAAEDEFLREMTAQKGITDYRDLTPVKPRVYLWRGDITTLKCGAVVNAANSGMLGCFCPCHGCIDNAIHTFAGVRLRMECAEIMRRQGFEEPVGQAKVTGAYALPCEKIIHTVGPCVGGKLTEQHREETAVRTVFDFLQSNRDIEVIFNVFKNGDFQIYKRLLGTD